MNYIRAGILGLATGDAVGVPVEFKGRDSLKKKPVKDMECFGTHNQRLGTWSDDSSLAFCLTAALTKGYDLNLIGTYFCDWLFKSFWTPWGEVFDVGIATRESIHRLARGTDPLLAGGSTERENGNGSLMRILPLLFYHQHKPQEERFRLTKEVSSLTHRHIRAVIACFYYLEFAREIINGADKFQAFKKLQELPTFLESQGVDSSEIEKFSLFWSGDLSAISEDVIPSSGYVLHTLIASIWCILTTDNYKDAVLKAVNLGEDTDTTGAVTGGMAGLIYGADSIPAHWLNALARKEKIEFLIEDFIQSLT